MTATAIFEHFRRLWAHVLPKMRAVLASHDAVEIGWAAAVMMNEVLRTVWAVNNRPSPSLDLGTVRRHLDDLSVPAGVADTLRRLLRDPASTETLRGQVARPSNPFSEWVPAADRAPYAG